MDESELRTLHAEPGPHSLGMRDALVAIGLAVLVGIAFHRLPWAEFTPLDDHDYVVHNDLVQSGLTWSSIVEACTTLRQANWHPLTWLSLMADHQVWGLDPLGYHLTNLLQHMLSTVLLYVALRLLTGDVSRSACVAALFGVHPQHVESVAWISERKDTLSTIFWMLTIICYERQVRTGSARWQMAALAAFACGLAAKQMLVTLPCVLVLLDIWPLGRLRGSSEGGIFLDGRRESLSGLITDLGRLIAEKWPYWLLVLLAAVVTVVAQSAGGAMRTLDHFPLLRRLGNALVSYVVYLWLTIYPVPLSIYYPYQYNNWGLAGPVVALVLLSSVTVVLVRGARAHPAPLVGWLWYLGTLVPVIGIIQVGQQALADRYMYVPHIGLFIALVWSIPTAAWRGIPCRIGSVAIVLVCTGLTIWQTGHWLTGDRLMNRALAVTRNNTVIHLGLGTWYAEQRQIDRAIAEYRRAVEIDPGNVPAWTNLAIEYSRAGLLPQARQASEQFARLKPNSSLPLVKYADVLLLQGEVQQAAAVLKRAEALPDKNADFHVVQGRLLLQTNQIPAAASAFEEALRQDAKSADAHYYLGIISQQSGHPQDAERHFRDAVRLSPELPEFRYGLALQLAQSERYAESRKELETLLKTSPNHKLSLDLLQTLRAVEQQK